MTQATVASVITIIVRSQSDRVFLCSYKNGEHVKCATFVYIKPTQSSRHVPTSMPLSAVGHCALKASRRLWAWFHAQGKILSIWSRRQKYGQNNRISSLVSAILLQCVIPMGTHFCCANHSRISAGRFLSGHERRKMEEGGVRSGGGAVSPGYYDTWNSLSSLLNLAHHCVISRYCVYPDRSLCSFPSVFPWQLCLCVHRRLWYSMSGRVY